jgi:DNA-binding MarR family transcriptional regulator
VIIITTIANCETICTDETNTPVSKELKQQFIKTMMRSKGLFLDFSTSVLKRKHFEDIGMLKFILLSIIKVSGGNVGLAYLSEYLSVSKPAVSKMLSILEKKNCLTRDIDNGNRRKIVITITENGRRQLEYAERIADCFIDHFINFIGVEDAKELIRITKKLSDAMERKIEKHNNAEIKEELNSEI